MRLLTQLVALLALAGYLHAQTPLPANTTLIGTEGVTITATTGTNVSYYFGAGSSYNLVKTLKLPAVISCSSATSASCTALGGDPAPGVAKSLYAVQQTTAFTVTTSASKVSVLALTPPPVVTPPVTPPPVNSVTMNLNNFVLTVGGVTYTINAGCSAVPTVQ